MARFPRNHRKWVAQEDISNSFLHSLAGDNSEEATPDPIPNSEVKLFCVDGTAWVTMWESRSSPAFFCFCAASAASLRRSRTKYASLLAPCSHSRKNKKRFIHRIRIMVLDARRLRRRFVGRVRIWAPWATLRSPTAILCRPSGALAARRCSPLPLPL